MSKHESAPLLKSVVGPGLRRDDVGEWAIAAPTHYRHPDEGRGPRKSMLALRFEGAQPLKEPPGDSEQEGPHG
jgi:hypothetical protein